MAQDIRHIASGIAAVVDANVIDARYVWVSAEDVPKALRQVDKLSHGLTYKPEIFTLDRKDNDTVCLKLA